MQRWDRGHQIRRAWILSKPPLPEVWLILPSINQSIVWENVWISWHRIPLSSPKKLENNYHSIVGYCVFGMQNRPEDNLLFYSSWKKKLCFVLTVSFVCNSTYCLLWPEIGLVTLMVPIDNRGTSLDFPAQLFKRERKFGYGCNDLTKMEVGLSLHIQLQFDVCW